MYYCLGPQEDSQVVRYGRVNERTRGSVPLSRTKKGNGYCLLSCCATPLQNIARLLIYYFLLCSYCCKERLCIIGLSPNKKPALSNYAQGGPKFLFSPWYHLNWKLTHKMRRIPTLQTRNDLMIHVRCLAPR